MDNESASAKLTAFVMAVSSALRAEPLEIARPTPTALSRHLILMYATLAAAGLPMRDIERFLRARCGINADVLFCDCCGKLSASFAQRVPSETRQPDVDFIALAVICYDVLKHHGFYPNDPEGPNMAAIEALRITLIKEGANVSNRWRFD